MFANLLSLNLVALLFPLTVVAGSHNVHLNRDHHELARRAGGDVQQFKRGPNSRWSFYNVETGNAGSCGQFHRNGDFTVAMNSAQMNPSWCFKTIRMTYNGKTTMATISDTCPGCGMNGLDLTEGLFSFFAPQSVGLIYGDWEFADGSPGGGAPAPKPTPKYTPPPPPPPPKPTPKYTPPPPPPPPSTTKAAAKTTTTSTTTTSTSSTTTTTSSTASNANLRAGNTTSTTSTSSVNYNVGPASGLASATGSVNRNATEVANLLDLAQAFVRLGGLAVAANGV